ncbi:hypothetical protein [Neobacillus cucumis]|uniref:Molybdopterin cofactor biosynthesis MoaD-related C-terminal domain-containing protein n=1 Tax=Neobacillus cucumis TaxID=1740721 RepID=A0A2N5HBS3_9BACI|nr:hypothetical protein [Neobacillus cucumis]PLS02965.1 hypothetical protein CVD27_17440 [Neobacillus cucumis]
MAERDLEFRGINIDHLGMYFEELGAKRVTDTFPYIFEAVGWSGQIRSEEEISFTAIFKVNAVKVRFIAENEDKLNEIIMHYRYKTTRIGG